MSKPKKVEKKKKYKYVLQEDGKFKPILIEDGDKKEKKNGWLHNNYSTSIIICYYNACYKGELKWEEKNFLEMNLK